jgi:arylsulfatase A-like enzyme
MVLNRNSARPNILVFFTDQQRWDTTGAHGNPLDLTPNFDRIAAQGTHAFNSFTCQPVCGPARSCLQTGLYATKSGCWRNGIPLPPQSRTLAHHFGAAGYDTGYIGKWHLADNDDGPVEPAQRGGYDDWLASNALEFTSDDYHTTVFNNDGRPVHLPGYRVDALTDAAIRYLDRHRKNPFYLFLSFLEPHHQNHLDNYPAPMGYAEKYAGRWVPPDLAALGGSAHQHLGGYFGMVKRLDEALGRLQDALISLDLWDNTVLLFSSDHACHFKTRNTEYKRSCHESSIRVPTALHGAMFEGGGRIKQLVSLIDLPPTLLDAAGLPVPPEMQGRSLVPLVESRDFDWPEEVFIQVSETEVGRAIRTHRWKYGVVAPDKNPVADAGSDTYSEEYLYDLLADPYELVDLSGLVTHREATDVLRERLIRRMVAAGEEAPRIRPAPPRPGGQRVVSSAEAHA